MQRPSLPSASRPYRSHSKPACIPCRRRKSRCRVESSAPCLMCQVHATECVFPSNSSTGIGSSRSRFQSLSRSRDQDHSSSPQSTRRYSYLATPDPTSASLPASRLQDPQDNEGDRASLRPTSAENDAIVSPTQCARTQASPSTPGTSLSCASTNATMSLDEAEEDNAHIVGPDIMHDSQVVADYLSLVHPSAGTLRLIRPQPGTRSGAVIFTKVRKQPLGVSALYSPSSSKLQVVEKLVEPWSRHLLDLYFSKENICLPLIDQKTFNTQMVEAKDRISPALLSTMYAHSLTYWRYDSVLSRSHCPDPRFVWNQANDALNSELYLSPSISTIIAILLNIGGRPTTSMVGNGVRLASAVSLAHSMGLNYNPLSWNIPEAEKGMRMKIWWTLTIHDGWLSLAHGTPPHIRRAQHNIPPPSLEYLGVDGGSDTRHRDAAEVFMALYSLTELLYRYLENVFLLNKSRPPQPGTTQQEPEQPPPASMYDNAGHDLDVWIDSLPTPCRRIVIRGTDLEAPGAANLRLAYLSIRLLTQRIELSRGRDEAERNPVWLSHRYTQARRTAEDIIIFTQELTHVQLGDFWQPAAAFTFSSTVTFLLRCALEIDDTSSAADLSQSTSLRMADDLLSLLRQRRDESGWDIGDICLGQHTDVVEKLMSTPIAESCAAEGKSRQEAIAQEMQQILMDPSSFDPIFTNLWDSIQDM